MIFRFRLTPLLLLAPMLALASLAPSPAVCRPDLDAARAARARAQQAVGEERWCEAAEEFARAYYYSLVPEALFNAAVAAELAMDRASAAEYFSLFAELSEHSPRRTEALERARGLSNDIRTSGAGKPCPPRPPDIERELAGAMEEEQEEVEHADAAPAEEEPEEVERADAAPAEEEPEEVERADAAPASETPGELSAAVLAPPPPRGGTSDTGSRIGPLGVLGWTLVGTGIGGAGGGAYFSWAAGRDARHLEEAAGSTPLRSFDQDLRNVEESLGQSRKYSSYCLAGGGALSALGLVLILLDAAAEP